MERVQPFPILIWVDPEDSHGHLELIDICFLVIFLNEYSNDFNSNSHKYFYHPKQTADLGRFFWPYLGTAWLFIWFRRMVVVFASGIWLLYLIQACLFQTVVKAATLARAGLSVFDWELLTSRELPKQMQGGLRWDGVGYGGVGRGGVGWAGVGWGGIGWGRVGWGEFSAAHRTTSF